MGKKEEIKEIHEILKKHGLDREERRQWIRTIKKQALIRQLKEESEHELQNKSKFFLLRKHQLQRLPNGKEVHYMFYEIHNQALSFYYSLAVPCRARLHHSLTGLFYNWNWKDENPKEITEEEAMMLKHVFTSRTEYKLWKQTLVQINKLGVDKAKEWLIDQVKVLALRNVLREN